MGQTLKCGQQLSAGLAHGVPAHVFHQGDRLGLVVQSIRPDQVAGHYAHDSIPKLVLVHQEAQSSAQRIINVSEALG
jgi:hypothetical protein